MSSELLPLLSFVLYTTANGDVKIRVVIRDETLWLTQKMMTELFEVNVPAISKHLKKYIRGGGMDEDSVISKMETTASDDKIYET